MNSLNQSLAIEADGTGRWRSAASRSYEAGNGMLGGWTAALLLKVVMSDPVAEGSVSTLSVNFISRVEPGSALTLVNRRLGGGRSITHWQSELLSEQGALLALATVIFAHRRPSDAFCEQAMPDAFAPETLSPSGPPEPFAANLDLRVALGAKYLDQSSSRSLTWEKEVSDAPLDELQIAMLSDIGPPRIFYYSQSPRPSATSTLSVYFHATPEEIATCGNDFVLSDMVGTRGEQSTFGTKKDMWSRSGNLLASSEQMCWFR